MKPLEVEMQDSDYLRPVQGRPDDGRLAPHGGSATFNSLTPDSEARRFSPSRKSYVVVVGAGAFGGWTALQLLRRGAKVTLLDAWGPGNSRSSSGDESRVLRGTYAREVYTKMVARARELWKESERRWGTKLLQEIGVLWMVGRDDSVAQAAVGFQQKAGLPVEELTTPEAARRFPQINFEDVRWAIWERAAGYLRARRACEAVLKASSGRVVTIDKCGSPPERSAGAR